MKTRTKLYRVGASALALAGLAAGMSTAAQAQTLVSPAPAPAPAPTGDPDLGTTTVKPYYGNIDPFYGRIDPFYGNIEPFWGNIDPFSGKVSPFYGNIEPFWGNIDPFYGNIEPFWGNIDPFTNGKNPVAPNWSALDPFWKATATGWKTTSGLWNTALASPGNITALAAVASSLQTELARSQQTWGAAITAKTGKSFNDAFAAPLLAKFGIDLAKPSTLASLTPTERAKFYLAWYDGLMAYSGHDRVDHWMATANWTPKVTQQQGTGADTIIGIIDSYLSGEADLQDNVISSKGKTGFAGGHGAGVASLIVASHNGEGVMGIAPNARVALYNPFDATGTTNWNDVRAGILSLKASNASIVNASFGESGSVLPTKWNGLFGSYSVAAYKNSTVYVISAGNEGITQANNVPWNSAQGTNFIVVGSVDPMGRISTFSNRPGTACLTLNGVCNSTAALTDGGLLMNHFITAPGELILVSDGQGGLVRRSGTSFAAPLVSGAIALLHDRWPWLAQDPSATVQIILGSAKDLGAPGPDPIYGVGLLDVTASQSPLDFNKLLFYKIENGVATNMTPATLQASGVQASWQANGVGFALFEWVGHSIRDFVVPMSSLLSGNVITAFGSKEQFQSFLTTRLTDFINGASQADFTDVMRYSSPDRGGWRMGFSAQSPANFLADRTGPVPHSAFRAIAPGNRFAMTAGYGEGAMELNAQRGFGLSTDYATDGGINPLLGFASGGSFFNTEFAFSGRTRVTFGYSERDSQAAKDLTRNRLVGFGDRSEDLTAHAMNVRVEHAFAPGSSLAVNYTRLREDNALLAVQATNDLLAGGATSESLTVSGSADAGHGLTLAASATGGRSAPAAGGQITARANGLLTTAYAVALTKNGVLNGHDRLRVSFAQPMHIEGGTLTLHSAGITDRATGAIGVTDIDFGVTSPARVHTGELLYASPILDNAGEVSLFGRATLGATSDQRTGYVAGVRVHIKM